MQWDTSEHDWSEGRGEEMLLINMIDDASGRWSARFVARDSTVENMNLRERQREEALEQFVNKVPIKINNLWVYV